MDGWIKLHRKILENPIVTKDTEHLSVWIYLLVNATHKEVSTVFKGEKITLKPGQLITGRKAISDRLHISESKVQRILKRFESDQQIEQQTSNKNRLITIVNWDIYQNAEQQNEQPVNGKRTASEQQVNTNKNDKNVKNEKKDNIDYQQIADMYNNTCISFPKLIRLSDSRKRAIKARLRTYSIEDFQKLFEMAEQSDFLKGKGNENWSATFDWLIKDSNMVKVLDGNYRNKGDKDYEQSSNEVRRTASDYYKEFLRCGESDGYS